MDILVPRANEGLNPDRLHFVVHDASEDYDHM